MSLLQEAHRDSVFYWRTKDKKEIDFILKMKDSLIPIEVKLNYEQFNPTAIRYFNEHYGIDNYRVVGLNGRDSGSGLYSCCVAPRAGAWGPGIKSLSLTTNRQTGNDTYFCYLKTRSPQR